MSTEQSESIGKLALALSKAQGSIDGAKKSADNPFFKSKYADLYECINAVREPLAANELAVIQTIEPGEHGITIATTLAHSSGEWIRGRITMNPKKDDDQGRGSSITYGRRYSFAAIVGLAQIDDDGNASCQTGNSNKSASPNKQKQQTQNQSSQKSSLAEWKGIIGEAITGGNIANAEGLASWRKANGNTIRNTLSKDEQVEFKEYLDSIASTFDIGDK